MSEYEKFAYRMGFDQPDKPNPFRKYSTSWLAWLKGREARLLKGKA